MQAVTRCFLRLTSQSLTQKCTTLVSPVVTRALHTGILRSLDTALRCPSTLLQPNVPSLTQSCGMKMKGQLRRRCADCYFVMRQGRLYVMCKSKGRHKQMSMVKKEKKTWTLSHATQGPHGLFPYYRRW